MILSHIVYQKFSVSMLALCLLFTEFSWILWSNLYSQHSRCFKRSHLCNRMLYIFIVYKEVIYRFFLKYICQYRGLLMRLRNFEQFYWMPPLFLGAVSYKVLHRFKQYLSIHKIFKNIIFELSSVISLKSIRNIIRGDAFF